MAKKTPKPEKQDAADLAESLLIREVDEEMRAQQMRELWKRYGAAFIGICVIAILATIGWQFYKHQQFEKSQEMTQKLLQANLLEQQNKSEKASEIYAQLIGDSNEEIAALSTLLRNGESSSNDADYKAALSSSNQAYANFAAIKTGKYGDVPANSPFYIAAQEQQALSLVKAGKLEEAKTLIVSLLERSDLSPSQRQRLELMQAGL